MSQTASKPKTETSGWANFKIPKGGTAQDIRKRANQIQTQVTREIKVFGTSSLVDGGTKVKG